AHIVLCVVKTRPPWLPLRFGLPNVNGTGSREAKKSDFPPGLSTNFPRDWEVGREPLLSNLLAIIFEPELRRVGFPLVGSPNPALHLMLHPVERVDFDQRLMLPAFDAAVQARPAAAPRARSGPVRRTASGGPRPPTPKNSVEASRGSTRSACRPPRRGGRPPETRPHSACTGGPSPDGWWDPLEGSRRLRG